MPTGESLDEIDLRILDLLRENARRTFADIGQHVPLSGPAVKRRVDRLERIGAITGYTALVDHSMLGQPLQAFAELRFSGRSRVDAIASIGDDIPEVQAVFTMAGDPDALAWIRVRDVEDLRRVVDLLRSSREIAGTKTLMVLSTSMQRRQEPRRPGN